jgi:hypothetical protein
MRIDLKTQIFFARSAVARMKKMYFGEPPPGFLSPRKALKQLIKIPLSGRWHGACCVRGKTHACNQGGEDERQKKNSHRR